MAASSQPGDAAGRPRRRGRETRDWRDAILEIATSWLFEDVPRDDFPTRLVLPFENPDLHDARQFLQHLESPSHHRALTTGLHEHKTVGLLTSKFGGPAVAMAVGAAGNRGAQMVIGVGFCGALSPELACGDIVLPLTAIGEDGTSSQYASILGQKPVASTATVDLIREAARCADLTWTEGSLVSVDAVLLESTADAKRWAGLGALAIDLECAAFFASARAAGVQAAAVLAVSDHVAAVSPADSSRLADGQSAAVRLAFDALTRAELS